MVSPGETTRDHWAFDSLYYIQRSREHTIKVKFSNDALCWAEVCWLDRSEDWDTNGAEWEIFCPTPADLGCDIYLNKLTAEELCHITEASETHTSHTCTPAPSETSKETTTSEPEHIHVLSPIQPSTGEQQLAALAESLHISTNIPMSNTVTVQAAMAAMQTFGVIDPVIRRIWDPEDAAIHWAIGPDQPDPPPGRGPQDSRFQEGASQQDHQKEVRDFQEVEAHLEEEETLGKDQTGWWEICLKCSQEYEWKWALPYSMGALC